MKKYVVSGLASLVMTALTFVLVAMSITTQAATRSHVQAHAAAAQ